MLAGKVYFITGSTDGIGKHTAQLLSQHGGSVIIHGRSPQRLADTAASLPHPPLASFVADFSDFTQVRHLADDVISKNITIDVLINNCGTFEQQKKTCASGLEKTWAVNVAAPYLLTSRLFDIIKERIVNVASISAASSIDFNNLQQERGFSSHAAYSLSKLANVMFNHELAARLKRAGSSVTANALDPGTVNTKMLYAGWGPIGMRVQDADDQFFLATDASVAAVSSAYYVSCRERRAPPPACDGDARARLWDILKEQTGAEWKI